jgi:hypothetical protein
MGLAKGGAMSDKLQWPETVDQAVGVLLGLLPDGEKAKIAAMSQDDLVALHLGLGMWIRNNLGLWSEKVPFWNRPARKTLTMPLS